MVSDDTSWQVTNWVRCLSIGRVFTTFTTRGRPKNGFRYRARPYDTSSSRQVRIGAFDGRRKMTTTG